MLVEPPALTRSEPFYFGLASVLAAQIATWIWALRLPSPAEPEAEMVQRMRAIISVATRLQIPGWVIVAVSVAIAVWIGDIDEQPNREPVRVDNFAATLGMIYVAFSMILAWAVVIARCWGITETGRFRGGRITLVAWGVLNTFVPIVYLASVALAVLSDRGVVSGTAITLAPGTIAILMVQFATWIWILPRQAQREGTVDGDASSIGLALTESDPISLDTELA